MFSTLQAAFGTWPSEVAFSTGRVVGRNHPTTTPGSSGLNETTSFEDDNIPPASPVTATSVFTLRPQKYPSDKPFVPPYFVPPSNRRTINPESPTERVDGIWKGHAGFSPPQPGSSTRPIGSPVISPSQRSDVYPESLDELAAATPLLSDRQGGPQEPFRRDETSRSPSPRPPQGVDLQHEQEANWSDSARRAFQTMVTAPVYVNRYRLNPNKRQRMLHYLRNPDTEPRNPDGTKDYQTKYQAVHWTLDRGQLYRKPDSGRVGIPRRHLDESEVWDVLTAEHLRSGVHLGRDKLRKRLEASYIGYTLQEIMFVLRECWRCGGKGAKGEMSERLDERSMRQAEPQDGISLDDDVSSGTFTVNREQSVSGRALPRKQASNAMFP